MSPATIFAEKAPLPNQDVPIVHFYADLLLNIRNVSFACWVTPTTNPIRIWDSGDDRRISIKYKEPHENSAWHTAHFSFPATLQPHISGSRVLNEQRNKSVDRRVRVEQFDSQIVTDAEDHAQKVPWCASELTQECSIRCRECNSTIIDRNRMISGWKDLPSEGWAEMVDFWHCHKPHESHDHDDNGMNAKRQFTSDSIRAQSGVGLIDALSFLVTPSDCSCVEEVGVLVLSPQSFGSAIIPIYLRFLELACFPFP